MKTKKLALLLFSTLMLLAFSGCSESEEAQEKRQAKIDAKTIPIIREQIVAFNNGDYEEVKKLYQKARKLNGLRKKDQINTRNMSLALRLTGGINFLKSSPKVEKELDPDRFDRIFQKGYYNLGFMMRHGQSGSSFHITDRDFQKLGIEKDEYFVEPQKDNIRRGSFFF